ncbi:CaiB/BaiF CoA-transferase family protein [Sinimarinibacterium flocculans]|uniref:Crotonobetainyl-CoA:carnitine CoA-transferase CaiB-like acyl-CoA transferase n=1 Tax=Sinimarinibacterium flocculans TaxID=985250 RepID=A0A318EM56_9GAMM|nr:CoA transferase [Sinimarinibacterium flocculans]PXV70290.1 crotonobetainyl-CoA:carnitine CoA-transferase CaiB-like acyl-CoA transferase [Sinimarinibacterium flocculans]
MTISFPFAALQVVELSGHVAGACCGKLMAGFGAEVVQIDGGHDAALDAAAQTWFHSGKRRLPARPDRATLERLLRRADIVIDAWGVDVLAGAGFDAATLRQLNSQAIVCRITPYGLNGPKRDWVADDITLYASAGLMHSTGDGRRAPLNAGPRIAELSAGMNACFACVGALLRRRRDGGGDDIDLAIVEAAMDNYEVALMEALALGRIARRNGDEHAMVPWRTYPCADGEAAIIGGPIRHWLKAAAMFEAPGLLDPKLATMADRIARRAETEALMRPWLATQTRQALFHAGQKAGLAWAPLASISDALTDPQHAARGYFIDAPGGGRMPGAPFRLQRGAWSEDALPAAVGGGEDRAHAQTPAAPAPSSVPAGHPLPQAGEENGAAPFAGLRVLDFSHDWAGPHAARLFADYGAEVIKIEYPRRLDGMRGGYVERVDAHPRFWQLHRGKQSLTLDLKRDADRAVLDQLVGDADLVIENSRPGVMARKGYDYARLQALNPRLVLLSMSAFGASGPYAPYCGYGGTLEAASGLQSLTAYDAHSRWFRVREMDVMNGIMGACAAAIALWQRAQDGPGQWIDLSENETTAWFAGEFFLRAARTGQQPAPRGNRHDVHAPQGCYACAGEDRWLTLCVRSDEEWRRLATRIGGAATAARWSTAAQRRAHHDEIDALLANWLRPREAAQAAAELQALGIAAAPVMNAAELIADAQLAARGWFLQVGDDRLPGLPFRYARGGGAVRARGPRLGDANAHWFGAAGQTPPALHPDSIGTAYAIA